MKYSHLIMMILLSNNCIAQININEITDNITICHYPPGNVENVQQLTLNKNALKTHLDHHDDIILVTGECSKGEFLICNNGKNEKILKSEWKKENNLKNYYVGECKTDIYPLPKPESFISIPEEKITEYIKFTGTNRCVEGKKESDNDVFNATIKRTVISNAFIINSTIDNINPNNIKYGIISSNIGLTDLKSGVVDHNKVIGAELQNVEVTNLFLDTERDYIDSNGNNIDGGTYISVYGGELLEKFQLSENKVVNPVTSYGVIVYGVDAFGEPVRGTLLTGKIDKLQELDQSTLTKVRRFKGSVKNAIITDATVIMQNGVAVIVAGHLISGDFFGENISFGTTFFTIPLKTNIRETNHCFTPGSTVQQLNWREVVK